MTALRRCNDVNSPVGVRSLAQLAGIAGTVSLRELMIQLGDRSFAPMPLYILGHNTKPNDLTV